LARCGRSPGGRRHDTIKPACMALTPILRPPPGSPERRAAPRRSVAFVKYVTTLCLPATTASRAPLARLCPATSAKSSPSALAGDPADSGTRPGLFEACISAVPRRGRWVRLGRVVRSFASATVPTGQQQTMPPRVRPVPPHPAWRRTEPARTCPLVVISRDHVPSSVGSGANCSSSRRLGLLELVTVHVAHHPPHVVDVVA
jgi:hypothetical protein